MPYAKAPIGHLRWKKPISWWSDGEWCGRKERRRAHKYAKPCIHIDPETHKLKGNEDCLYLNVWSPRLDTSVSAIFSFFLHYNFLSKERTCSLCNIFNYVKQELIVTSQNLR